MCTVNINDNYYYSICPVFLLADTKLLRYSRVIYAIRVD